MPPAALISSIASKVASTWEDSTAAVTPVSEYRTPTLTGSAFDMFDLDVELTAFRKNFEPPLARSTLDNLPQLCATGSCGMPSIGHSAMPGMERVIASTILRVPSGSSIHLP